MSSSASHYRLSYSPVSEHVVCQPPAWSATSLPVHAARLLCREGVPPTCLGCCQLLVIRRPQPAEIPAARRASPRHIPEGIPIASPVISRAPPVTPAPSQPSSSAEPRMAIPISEYRELCRSLQTLTASQSSLAQEMAAIRACQEQIFATQIQHTAILRQIQHHLGIISPPKHSIPIPQEPSQAPHFVHQTMLPEELTTGEAEAVEPSSPHHPPATI
ncbi:hypothetical protein CK203_050058 [Vitis vinifera]|uniref:Uncharacterized protein n=1 Tax=Vitis vinifera TaxID=29760 RepID=A0A438H4H4_VITVI|nr:hypothetical protein CK203_050058 [Vitis vinifera]